MVHLFETAHAAKLLERYAPKRVIDRALCAAGLDRRILSGLPGFIPYAAEAVMVETVARSIGDRHLGARLGRDFDYATYGAFASYVLGARDLASAMHRGRRALVVTHPGSSIEMRQEEGHLVVGRSTAGLSVVGHRHLDEGALFVILKSVRHFAGPDWCPDWVEVPEMRSGDAETLSALIEAPVRTGAAMPSIAIGIGDLAAKNPVWASTRNGVKLQELPDLMGVETSQTMESSVRQILRVHRPTLDVSEEAVARYLAISRRSLQRALKSEGTTFREVRAQAIAERARALLTGSDLGVTMIAKTLGYDEPKSFRRAFRTWTGMSPADYRASQKDP
ncbi:helix-turn-helix domain-containing protein [Psychromarinibacter sp. S121]|uniref:helix-turn-helix domain-containing protein n=1 Tax=Psychromarinibacter sp. S121 TaxID=3415127 RepID=UPI003C7E4F11